MSIMTEHLETEKKFSALQTALTQLAASGVSIQFAEIYHCGQRMTPIIMANVTIDDHGRLAMTEER